MHVAEVTWHRLFRRSMRVWIYESASRSARQVSRYCLAQQDHAAALLWKRRQLSFAERAKLADAATS